MKISKIFSFLMLLSAIGMVACSEKNAPSGPGGGGGGGGKDTSFVINIDTTKAISLQEAIAKAGSSDTVVIKGYVSYAYATSVSSSTGRREQSAWIAEKATDKAGVIQAYYCTIKDSVAKGDFVAVQGLVTMHIKNATDTVYEIKNGKMQLFRKKAPVVTKGDGTEKNPYTIADVQGLGTTLSGKYFVKGYIVGQVNGKSISDATWEKAAPFTSTDVFATGTNIVVADLATETQSSNIIAVSLPKGTIRDSVNLPANPSNLGAEVVIYGSINSYFGGAGMKDPDYISVNGRGFGSKPYSGEALLNETLLTQASFDKFTAVSVTGPEKWAFADKYGAKISGYVDSLKTSRANEDWLISPAFDATKGGTLTFDHARGPNISATLVSYYKVLVSNDFAGDVTTATWTEISIPTHPTTKWAYVSSGEMAIPADNCAPNCRIAWKYTCGTSSETWEVKNVLVK